MSLRIVHSQSLKCIEKRGLRLLSNSKPPSYSSLLWNCQSIQRRGRLRVWLHHLWPKIFTRCLFHTTKESLPPLIDSLHNITAYPSLTLWTPLTFSLSMLPLIMWFQKKSLVEGNKALRIHILLIYPSKLSSTFLDVAYALELHYEFFQASIWSFWTASKYVIFLDQ